MIKDSKKRVMISIPKSLDDDVATLAGQMGITKSAFIALCVGEKVMGYKKAFEICSDTLKTYAEESIIRPIGG